MLFYEVIYESGNHSIMAVESEDEMLEGVKTHHARAVAGDIGGPHGTAAERVSRVLKYESHPGDLYEEQVLPASEVKSLVTELTKNKAEINVMELAAAVRDLSNPQMESGPHESNYKMDAVAEIAPTKWGGE